MSLIVKTVTDWLKVFILLFGIYLVVYGHLTPGGGFAGGVVVACAFILLTLAEGAGVGEKTLSRSVASKLDSLGALIFLGVAVAGVLWLGGFFKNTETAPSAWYSLLSGGLIPISNLGIGLKVGMSLFMVFTILAAVRVGLRGGKRKVIRRGRE
jgi:multicomponent Na+:H+ antiporter subunit B